MWGSDHALRSREREDALGRAEHDDQGPCRRPASPLHAERSPTNPASWLDQTEAAVSPSSGRALPCSLHLGCYHGPRGVALALPDPAGDAGVGRSRGAGESTAWRSTAPPTRYAR